MLANVSAILVLVSERHEYPEWYKNSFIFEHTIPLVLRQGCSLPEQESYSAFQCILSLSGEVARVWVGGRRGEKIGL